VEPVVLVDANNAIRSRWPNIRPDTFVELARAWAAGAGVRAVIVFDGPAPSDPAGTGDLVGTRGESADDWIAREAERLAADGRRVWLVSSDRGLRQRVGPDVERTIGGGSFATLLEELDAER
jgi:hypothetical protein